MMKLQEKKVETNDIDDDVHEKQGGIYFDAAMKNDKEPDLYKKAAEEFSQSIDPEGKEKAILCMSIYFRGKGKLEKDPKKAKKWFLKALTEIKKSGETDIKTIKSFELEFVKKKIEIEETRYKKPLIETLLRIASIYKDLGNEKFFNISMSQYHMFVITSGKSNLSNDDIIKNADLMLGYAKKGEVPDMLARIEGLYHRIKSNYVFNPKERYKELTKTVESLGKTSDHFGLEEAETEQLMAKAMLTVNTQKRGEMLKVVADKYHKVGANDKELFVRKLLSPVPLKALQIVHMADESLEKLRKLEITLNEIKGSEKGPFKIFYHTVYLQTRIKDVKRILIRMVNSRKRLTELHIKEEILRPQKINQKTVTSKRLNVVQQETGELTAQMTQDLNSLLIYGNLLLDQLSYIVGLVAGYEVPDSPRLAAETYYSDFKKIFTGEKARKELNEFWSKYKESIPKSELELNYAGIFNLLQSNKYSGELKEFWIKHKRDMIWLTYHLRYFRNVFVEHLRKPWQLGSTMGMYGDDFNFHIPRAVGLIKAEEETKILTEIYPLAPQRLKDMPDDYWEKKNLHRVLEVTMLFIDEIEKQQDRQKVWDAWHMLGGSTPSYDVIAARLFKYLSGSLDTVSDLLSSNPSLVKFGKF